MPSPAEQIEQLREKIRRHDRLYYVEAKPEISDREYDRLLEKLEKLEAEHPDLVTPDSPTQRVGGEPIEGFRTVRHVVPMLSIDNTYSRADLEEFARRLRKALGDESFRYLVDPKIDGVAVSLRYEGRMLVQAVTRGNGREGDDVTSNVRTIKSIPLNLGRKDAPDVFEVRGEIYWPRGDFQRFNRKRENSGEEPFANPRNATAGTLKLLDPRIVAQRGLAFLAHGFGELSDPPSESTDEIMNFLRVCGVPVSRQRTVCDDLDDVWSAIERWDTERADAEYDTDGMVIKVDELPLREQLGATSKYPRWCIAYKYETDRAATVLREVSFQVGRTGVVTPVAHFDPVSLGGTTVANASLHNFDNVANLYDGNGKRTGKDVRVGDTVVVEKAGEIIPQVVDVELDRRPRNAMKMDPPETCPCPKNAKLSWRPVPEGYVAYRCTNGQCELGYTRQTARNVPDACRECARPVEEVDHMVDLLCTRDDCPERAREGIIFFAGRGQMDIEGLGPEVVQQLIDEGRVSHVADLYGLTVDDLLPLERFAETSANNLVQAIIDSKHRGLATVLRSLGVRHVGARASDIFTGTFGDIGALLDASIEDLQKPREIGPKIAESLYKYLHGPVGSQTVARLRNAGVDMTAGQAGQDGAGPLAGKTVVVTGTLERLSRSDAESAIEASGGRATSSVSGNTDFLLAGQNAGSKLDKARDLGVEVIDEAEFLRRLGKDALQQETDGGESSGGGATLF
jgi:DNA ligase (NAD+)